MLYLCDVHHLFHTHAEVQDQCLVVQISYAIMKSIQAFHFLLMSLQECCKYVINILN